MDPSILIVSAASSTALEWQFVPWPEGQLEEYFDQ